MVATRPLCAPSGLASSLLALGVAVSCSLAAPAAYADDGLRKGPWLMDLRADSVVVMLERDEPGPARVRAWPVGPSGAAADAGSDAGSPLPPAVEVTSDERRAIHELALTGLRPGLRYRYEVLGVGFETAGGSFTTPPLGDEPFRFVLYGDTRSDDEAHRAVVEAVRRVGPDFVVHTGDLVADGRDLDDWQNFFEIERPLLRSAPFVPVIGNHEIVRPLSSGIDNFRRYVHVDPSGPSPELDYVFRFGNARFVLVNAYDEWTGASRDWLESELARARREAPHAWLFVVMHWGPRSSGPHGDNYSLRAAGVDTVLRRAGVDLVVAGHDHVYERGDFEGLRYLVTGGGGAPLYYRRYARAGVMAFEAEHHFVQVDLERERLTLTAFRTDGSVLDRAVLTHQGWQSPTPAPTPGPEPSAPEPVRPRPPEEGGCETRWYAAGRLAPIGLLALLVVGYLRLRRGGSGRRPPRGGGG